MRVDIHTNAAALAAKFRAKDTTLDAELEAVKRDVGSLALRTIRAAVSGRPGPRVRTGDYRRSWTLKFLPDGFSIGTNRPQARRLEYGFVGADRLGRVYNQPPYPHVAPTRDKVAPEWVARLMRVMTP